MSIEIKEYSNAVARSVSEKAFPDSINLSEAMSTNSLIDPSSLMVDIEGIHVGPTRNYTWYTEQALLSSAPTWTKPYLRPLIMHHNEQDGKIIGRIHNATYVDKNTRSGTPALEFVANVPDEEGKKQILDGRLNTVSIGVIAHDVRCSICGEQITEVYEDGTSNCGHAKGAEYDGKICYWKIYKMEAKELSYVIVPSDPFAHNKNIYKPEKSKVGLKESNLEGVFNLSEQNNSTGIETKESQVIDETGVKETVTETPVEQAQEQPVVKTEGADLTQEVKDLKLEIYNITKEKEALVKELEDAKKAILKANQDIEKVQQDLQAKASELQSEVSLREAAETQVVEIKTQFRESLIDSVLDLRTALNKQVITKEELSKRSDDSIIDSLHDLKEEMSGVASVKSIQEAADPSLNQEKIEKPEVKHVKESKTAGNINLEEGLKDIMSDLFKTKFN